MFQRLERSAGLTAVVVFGLVWSALHTVIRLFAGTRLALDDGKENIFTQSFQFGYLPDNPPLFEWVLGIIQHVTGPNLFSFLILKYVLFIISLVFAYLTAKRLLRDTVWASLTALSLIMLYQIGWNYDQVFTHSLMVTVFSTAAIWAFVKLVQDRTLLAYVIFAGIVGLGSLSKYNFSGLIAALFVSALLSKETRRVILDLRFVLTPIAILVCLAAPLLYLREHAGFYEMYLNGKLGLTKAPHIERVGEGLVSLLVAFLSFYLPLALFVGALFPKAFSRKLPPAEKVDQSTLNCLGRSAVIVMVGMIIGVAAVGVSAVSERYMIPLLLPSFFWLGGRLKSAAHKPGASAKWVMALSATFLVIVGLRFTELAVANEPFCDRCPRWEPYDQMTDRVEDILGDQDAVLVAYENDTAGNLRSAFPDLSVRSLLLPFYRPPLHSEQPPCYFIWSAEVARAPVVDVFRPYAEAPGTEIVEADWQHPFKESWHQTRWGISPVDQQSSFYRDYCVSE